MTWEELPAVLGLDASMASRAHPFNPASRLTCCSTAEY
jgi:hypothetical protein